MNRCTALATRFHSLIMNEVSAADFSTYKISIGIENSICFSFDISHLPNNNTKNNYRLNYSECFHISVDILCICFITS